MSSEGHCSRSVLLSSSFRLNIPAISLNIKMSYIFYSAQCCCYARHFRIGSAFSDIVSVGWFLQPLQNMGGPLQPIISQQPLQQGMPSQNVTSKPSLPSTWSDHSVDISLDFLGPGMQQPKPNQPSLNALQHGEKSSKHLANYMSFTIWHLY